MQLSPQLKTKLLSLFITAESSANNNLAFAKSDKKKIA